MTLRQPITISDTIMPPITPTNAPDIPGLAFRGYDGPTDYDIMAAIYSDCAKQDKAQTSFNAERIQHEMARRSNLDPRRDILLAEISGQPVGYGFAYWIREETGRRAYVTAGKVAPAWRRRGIGGAIYRRNLSLLSALARDHPSDGPRVSEMWVTEGETDLHAMAEKLDYRPSVFFEEMVRPNLDNIEDAPMPAGLEVRAVQPEDYRAIWDADREAFRDHWGFIPPTEQAYQAFLNDPTFDPTLWRVAWAGDEVAGMVRSFINEKENAEFGRRRGHTEYISVRRPWRRRGLAKSLLAQSLLAVKERGMEEAALGVHIDNPNGARQLYKSMGFRRVERTTCYQKPMEDTQGETL